MLVKVCWISVDDLVLEVFVYLFDCDGLFVVIVMIFDCKGYGIYCVCVLDGLVDIIFDIFEVNLVDMFVDGSSVNLEVVLCEVFSGDLLCLWLLCCVVSW